MTVELRAVPTNVPAAAVTVAEPPKAIAEPFTVTEEFASIVLDTVPESPVVTSVPVTLGMVTVPPAAAAAFKVAVPEAEPAKVAPPELTAGVVNAGDAPNEVKEEDVEALVKSVALVGIAVPLILVAVATPREGVVNAGDAPNEVKEDAVTVDGMVVPVNCATGNNTPDTKVPDVI